MRFYSSLASRPFPSAFTLGWRGGNIKAEVKGLLARLVLFICSMWFDMLHCKNGIVKVTNVGLLVSAVARIEQLVCCSGYIHLTP